MYVCVWKTAKEKCTFHFLHPMTLAILWSSTPAPSLPYLLLDCHWDDSVDNCCNSGGEGTVSPRLGRLANLSPRLLLTPRGYSRQYFHFSRPINVSRTGRLNGWSSVTSVCWQEKHPRHLIWPVSSFQDADVAQRRVGKKERGPGIWVAAMHWRFYKAHWLPPKGHCIYVALLIRCECLNGHGSFSQERFWYSSNRVNLFSG